MKLRRHHYAGRQPTREKTVSIRAMSPAERYRQLLAAGRISEDGEQARAVALLDELHGRLTRRPRRAWAAPWRKVRRGETGLYLWGGVGRGKTMLMDLFYDSLSVGELVGDGRGGKLRMHFHRFMQRVHGELKSRAGGANPLPRIAESFAERTRVLCFDEFFVSDIGDAMILGELMRALFRRGLTLVATSNIHPDGLYENGLQRRRFLPAIEALKRHALVHELGGEIDFRLRVLERAEIYHSPLDAAAEQSLSASFAELAPEPAAADADLEVENRLMCTRRLAPDVVWFEFKALCEGPRSQNDYIELARCFHTVLVSNVPRFTAKSEDAARRFISLVDEFYDRNVKLIVSAEAPIAQLYGGELLQVEFDRTRSRLLEMQSREYLGRSHKGD